MSVFPECQDEHCEKVICSADFGEFNCSHGCQDSPAGRICTCPENMQLSANGYTCDIGKLIEGANLLQMRGERAPLSS